MRIANTINAKAHVVLRKPKCEVILPRNEDAKEEVVIAFTVKPAVSVGVHLLNGATVECTRNEAIVIYNTIGQQLGLT